MTAATLPGLAPSVSVLTPDLLEALAHIEAAEETEIGLVGLVCRLHEAAFGPCFVDGDGPELDEPECYSATYAWIVERADEIRAAGGVSSMSSRPSAQFGRELSDAAAAATLVESEGA